MVYHNNEITVKDIEDLMKNWDFKGNSKHNIDPSKISIISYKIVYCKCNKRHKWIEKVGKMY